MQKLNLKKKKNANLISNLNRWKSSTFIFELDWTLPFFVSLVAQCPFSDTKFLLALGTSVWSETFFFFDRHGQHRWRSLFRLTVFIENVYHIETWLVRFGIQGSIFYVNVVFTYIIQIMSIDDMFWLYENWRRYYQYIKVENTGKHNRL